MEDIWYNGAKSNVLNSIIYLDINSKGARDAMWKRNE